MTVETRNGFTTDERPGFPRWGTFEITEDHIKLVQHSNWYWNICEWGAPAMVEKAFDLMKAALAPQADKENPNA